MIGTNLLEASVERDNLESRGDSGWQSAVISSMLQRFLTLAELEHNGHTINLPSVAAHITSGYVEAKQHAPNELKPRLPGCYLPLNMVHQTEPRVSAVARALSALCTLVRFRSEDGVSVSPNGFRLTRLAAWTTKIKPGDTEPLEHYLAAGVCNVACEFCYEFGTPAEMRTPKQRAKPSELQTRLKYYEPTAGRALFDVFHQYYDAFSHPDCLDVLRRVRARSDGVLDLISNGRTLTPEVVRELPALRPLHLTISLNSADPGKRAIVMRDKTPEVAAQSLPLLAELNVPFGIVIVPWPPLIDENDMAETIRFVDKYSPNFVSISLPGFSSYLPDVPPELNEDYHRRIVSKIRALRAEFQTPLLIQPRHAEADWYGEDHAQPFVLGAMPRSAARRAGLQYGDVIIAINEMRTKWAYSAHRFIELLELNYESRAELTIMRGGEYFDKKLEITNSERGIGRGFGLIVGQGLNPAVLHPIIEAIHAGETVWILSSSLMTRTVSDMLQSMLGLQALPTTAHIHVVDNSYFGGNIQLGDLLTVADYESFLSRALKTSEPPDRIFIPGSPFSDWGHDLRGQNRVTLLRKYRVPIEFLPSNRIMV